MSKYERLTRARQVLNLPEQATIEEIKANYRDQLLRWHPDTCDKPKTRCQEMTARIVSAYKTMMDYCKHYRFSFAKQDVDRRALENDWWFERFGNDPVWGKASNDESGPES